MCTVAPAVAGAESTGLRARTRSERPPSQAVAQWRGRRFARPYRCASAPDFEPDSLARGGRDRLREEP